MTKFQFISIPCLDLIAQGFFECPKQLDMGVRKFLHFSILIRR